MVFLSFGAGLDGANVADFELSPRYYSLPVITRGLNLLFPFGFWISPGSFYQTVEILRKKMQQDQRKKVISLHDSELVLDPLISNESWQNQFQDENFFSRF